MTGDHHHGELVEEDRKVSTIDTKSKINITLILVITSILVISYEQIVFLIVITVSLYAVYKVKFRSIITKSLVPLPLIISLSILAFISYPEEGMLSFGGYTITYSRWELTIFFMLRSSIIIFLSLLLIESEHSFFEIIYALDEMKVPGTIINLLLLMYRSALDLRIEAKRMIDARYSRSSKRRWGTNLYTYRVLGYMLGGILVRAFLKKDQRRDALYSRRFTGTLYHTAKPFSFNGLLLLWIIMIVALVLLLNTDMHFLSVGTL